MSAWRSTAGSPTARRHRPLGRPAARRRRVDDDDRLDRLARRANLARELERDERAVAVAADDVGPCGPQLAQRAQPVGGHRLDRVGDRAAVEPCGCTT
jgi:hypothetical protein